jgi:hypothetical protein
VHRCVKSRYKGERSLTSQGTLSVAVAALACADQPVLLQHRKVRSVLAWTGNGNRASHDRLHPRPGLARSGLPAMAAAQVNRAILNLTCNYAI